MYVLIGANGNITAKAVRLLLAQGKAVRVVGRSREHLRPLQDAGAQITVGDAADPGFLTAALRGATAAYTMIPPNYAAADPRGEQRRIGEAIAMAIEDSGVRHVVNLSSGGAHLPAGTGPIAGLHEQEQRLNSLPGVSLLHLRPGYFFENHLHAAALIKALEIYPSMEASDAPIPMIATQDIAAIVVRELQRVGEPPGHRPLHLRGPRLYTMAEAARILGAAIGKPGLAHVRSEPAQAKAGMVEHGFSAAMADLFEEMAVALSDGRIADGFTSGPTETTPTALEDFAPMFAAVYRGL